MKLSRKKKLLDYMHLFYNHTFAVIIIEEVSLDMF